MAMSIEERAEARAAKKEEKKPAADPAAIDEVFRQATEMFE